MNTTDLKTPVSESEARTIMGLNFFGINEAVRYLPIVPTDSQISFFLTIPFSEETLRACKDTHILVAVFPMTILEIRGYVRNRFSEPIFYDYDRRECEMFLVDVAEMGWHLLRKEPEPGSSMKQWKDQQTVLSAGESVSKISVVAYAMVGHFLNTGERLFGNTYVRCGDALGTRKHAVIGFSSRAGFDIAALPDDYAFEYIGLASARKREPIP